KQLQKGANDSRSDDFARVTQALASWLNADGNVLRQYAPVLFADRANRGVDHDVCGGLLACIEHDWADKNVRAALRNSTKPLNESFYCRIFYKLFLGTPDDVNDGFLQSRYMVKAYRLVFTGPASAKVMSDDENNEDSLPVLK
ncbi:hypothetical protein K438DRAFT_1628991, partial [Mycena galopus ATCC 62051]